MSIKEIAKIELSTKYGSARSSWSDTEAINAPRVLMHGLVEALKLYDMKLLNL